jgi:hypothetical protein
MARSLRVNRAGQVGHTRKFINACKILAGNPEGNRPLVRRRRRWEDNIRIVLKINSI